MNKKTVNSILLLLVLVASGIFLLGGRTEMVERTSKISLITDKNRVKIGQEKYGGYKVTNYGSDYPAVFKSSEEIEFSIPHNNIVFSTEDNTVFPGNSITKLETNEGITPGFIGENGVVAIFTREDGTGWSCRPGTKITWTFEKYGNQKHINQTIAIGYIKDGIMYTPEIYQEELAGKYQVEFEDIGNIYIYIMCMAADPIAVKEGIIEIQEKGDT